MADTEVRETKRQVIFVMLVPTGQVLPGFQRPLAASNNPHLLPLSVRLGDGFLLSLSQS